MKTIEIQGETGLSVIAVNESLDNLEKYVPDGRRVVIITDPNVNRLYGARFPKAEVIEVGQGEGIKTLETVESLYKRMLDLEVDRSCFVVGIGGGIVCDIAGFVASTYMRGLPFGFVSTTLLSQVDASVGGKNGVNFHGYKNIIGVFRQPSFVICDLEMLRTLPADVFVCGFAEIVKHAAIADPQLFAFLEEQYRQALDMDTTVLQRLVYDSVAIKAGIVRKDETETGERRKLNFGHTLAHSLQTNLHLDHGEAVAIGMVFAANYSVHQNLLVPQDARRIKTLIESLHLPTRKNVLPGNLKDAIRKDKKKERQSIHFVLLKRIGEAIIREISLTELEAAIDDLY